MKLFSTTILLKFYLEIEKKKLPQNSKKLPSKVANNPTRQQISFQQVHICFVRLRHRVCNMGTGNPRTGEKNP